MGRRLGGTGDQLVAKKVTAIDGQWVELAPIKLDRAGSITGTVQDKATNAPIEGICAHAWAYRPGAGKDVRAGCTDAAGHYTISGLGPYDWPVEFTNGPTNYAWQWSGGADNRYGAAKAHVTVGGSATSNAKLAPGATVTGSLIDTTGHIWDTIVNAYNVVTGDYAAPPALTVPRSKHPYTLTNLGTQFVNISYSTRVPCWYDGTTDPKRAKAYQVTAGQSTKLDLTGCGD